MQGLLVTILISCIVTIIFSNAYYSETPNIIFNVLDYGVVSDGIRDDSQAFLEAWNEICNHSGNENPVLVIPNHEYIVNPVVFNGPCKPKSITIQIYGTILAPASPKAWEGLTKSQWLVFRGIDGLNVVGGGRIDGRGSGWWGQSCRDHPDLVGCTSLAPTAIKFISCKNLSLKGIHFINSSQTHVSLLGCDGIYINNLTIEAPERSPNTDGIHIQSSHNVIITNIVIRTGDDCVSIGDHNSNIQIYNILCGPGHGISIGSLGKGGNFVDVENIYVGKVYLKGTTNGARIKTWQGYVRGVVFEQFYFRHVKNPIIIDQNYCNVRGACKEMKTGVRISEVVFNEFFGTSSTDVAINLNCSRSIACTEIFLKTIQLMPSEPGHSLTSSCTNAYGYSIGMVEPIPCLQNLI